MALHERRAASATLADQAQARTIAPAAERYHHDHSYHGHDDRDHDDHGHEHDHPFEWMEMARIALVAITAAAVWFRVWEPLPAVSVIGVAGLTVGGWPVIKEAFEN